MNNYIIIGTQRSGSNFVCGTLRNLHQLGNPKEYFNPVHISNNDIPNYSKKNPTAYINLIQKRAEESNLPFALKIHYLQYLENFLKNDISIFEAFKPAQFIFLRRLNMVQQAISLWKAELTQSWTSKMDKVREEHYNFEEIKRRYFDLKIQDFAWMAILKKEKINFLNMCYGDLLVNKEKFFFTLLSYIGRSDLAELLVFPDIKIQRNKKTTEWENRFRAEYNTSDEEINYKLWIERTKYWQAEKLVTKDPNYWQPFK